ncbi:MAG: hypothetical protein ACOCQ7_00155 [Natronomonas sp.]
MDPTEDPETVVISAGAGSTTDGCSHDSTTLVGNDGGNNEYYRCSECNSVLIVPGTPLTPQPEPDVEPASPTHPLLDALRLDSDRRNRAEQRSVLHRLRRLFDSR